MTHCSIYLRILAFVICSTLQGILAVDWDERVLLDSSEIGSVGWSERLLTRDSGSYAVDWQNSILYDAAEDPVSWVSRTLSGEWSVAAAGSIDTPAFKYGGVTYAPKRCPSSPA